MFFMFDQFIVCGRHIDFLTYFLKVRREIYIYERKSRVSLYFLITVQDIDSYF